MHKIRDEKEIQNDNEETTNLFQPKIYSNIKWGGIAIKYGEGSHLFKVKYEYLKNAIGWPKAIQGFLPLDGRSLHILLPIPWLWKKIYNDKPTFNDKHFTWVDFL
jgi:hypothetical protein